MKKLLLLPLHQKIKKEKKSDCNSGSDDESLSATNKAKRQKIKDSKDDKPSSSKSLNRLEESSIITKEREEQLKNLAEEEGRNQAHNLASKIKDRLPEHFKVNEIELTESERKIKISKSIIVAAYNQALVEQLEEYRREYKDAIDKGIEHGMKQVMLDPNVTQYAGLYPQEYNEKLSETKKIIEEIDSAAQQHAQRDDKPPIAENKIFEKVKQLNYADLTRFCEKKADDTFNKQKNKLLDLAKEQAEADAVTQVQQSLRMPLKKTELMIDGFLVTAKLIVDTYNEQLCTTFKNSRYVPTSSEVEEQAKKIGKELASNSSNPDAEINLKSEEFFEQKDLFCDIAKKEYKEESANIRKTIEDLARENAKAHAARKSPASDSNPPGLLGYEQPWVRVYQDIFIEQLKEERQHQCDDAKSLGEKHGLELTVNEGVLKSTPYQGFYVEVYQKAQQTILKNTKTVSNEILKSIETYAFSDDHAPKAQHSIFDKAREFKSVEFLQYCERKSENSFVNLQSKLSIEAKKQGRKEGIAQADEIDTLPSTESNLTINGIIVKAKCIIDAYHTARSTSFTDCRNKIPNIIEEAQLYGKELVYTTPTPHSTLTIKSKTCLLPKHFYQAAKAAYESARPEAIKIVHAQGCAAAKSYLVCKSLPSDLKPPPLTINNKKVDNFLFLKIYEDAFLKIVNEHRKKLSNVTDLAKRHGLQLIIVPDSFVNLPFLDGVYSEVYKEISAEISKEASNILLKIIAAAKVCSIDDENVLQISDDVFNFRNADFEKFCLKKAEQGFNAEQANLIIAAKKLAEEHALQAVSAVKDLNIKILEKAQEFLKPVFLKLNGIEVKAKKVLDAYIKVLMAKIADYQQLYDKAAIAGEQYAISNFEQGSILKPDDYEQYGIFQWVFIDTYAQKITQLGEKIADIESKVREKAKKDARISNDLLNWKDSFKGINPKNIEYLDNVYKYEFNFVKGKITEAEAAGKSQAKNDALNQIKERNIDDQIIVQAKLKYGDYIDYYLQAYAAQMGLIANIRKQGAQRAELLVKEYSQMPARDNNIFDEIKKQFPELFEFYYKECEQKFNNLKESLLKKAETYSLRDAMEDAKEEKTPDKTNQKFDPVKQELGIIIFGGYYEKYEKLCKAQQAALIQGAQTESPDVKLDCSSGLPFNEIISQQDTSKYLKKYGKFIYNKLLSRWREQFGIDQKLVFDTATKDGTTHAEVLFAAGKKLQNKTSIFKNHPHGYSKIVFDEYWYPAYEQVYQDKKEARLSVFRNKAQELGNNGDSEFPDLNAFCASINVEGLKITSFEYNKAKGVFEKARAELNRKIADAKNAGEKDARQGKAKNINAQEEFGQQHEVYVTAYESTQQKINQAKEEGYKEGQRLAEANIPLPTSTVHYSSQLTTFGQAIFNVFFYKNVSIAYKNRSNELAQQAQRWSSGRGKLAAVKYLTFSQWYEDPAFVAEREQLCFKCYVRPVLESEFQEGRKQHIQEIEKNIYSIARGLADSCQGELTQLDQNKLKPYREKYGCLFATEFYPRLVAVFLGCKEAYAESAILDEFRESGSINEHMTIRLKHYKECTELVNGDLKVRESCLEMAIKAYNEVAACEASEMANLSMDSTGTTISDPIFAALAPLSTSSSSSTYVTTTLDEKRHSPAHLIGTLGFNANLPRSSHSSPRQSLSLLPPNSASRLPSSPTAPEFKHP